MNARFAAVALSSCLLVMLASQLLPGRWTLDLALAETRPAMLVADIGATDRAPSVVIAEPKPDQAPQVAEKPPITDAPQVVEIPKVVEQQQAAANPQAAIAAQPVEASQAVEAPQAASTQAAEAPRGQITDAAQAGTTKQTSDAKPAPDAPPSIEAPQAAVAQQAKAPESSDAPQLAAADKAAVTPTETAAPEPTPVAVAARVAAPPLVVAPVGAEIAAASEQSKTSKEPEARIEIASADSSDKLLDETTPVQAAQAIPADQIPSAVAARTDSVEVFDECFVVDICVDRYLWALYQRTPKQDKTRVDEQRKVTVKKRGKMITVTRTFSKLVDENFAWKDPKAADKVGLPLSDYVIGGMDRDFKLKLFHVLHAAEAAGLSPGITSAFRDDYRQSIASGLKAANDRSYHGGSSHGGYGHGLAADVVSVKGAPGPERWAATEAMWKWIDDHGKEFGIGRPYLGRDPPHVSPTEGQEYVSHRGTGTRMAKADVKKTKRLAAREDRRLAKRTKVIASSKAKATRSARNNLSRVAQAKSHG